MPRGPNTHHHQCSIVTIARWRDGSKIISIWLVLLFVHSLNNADGPSTRLASDEKLLLVKGMVQRSMDVLPCYCLAVGPIRNIIIPAAAIFME
jgi:hypothetical protein